MGRISEKKARKLASSTSLLYLCDGYTAAKSEMLMSSSLVQCASQAYILTTYDQERCQSGRMGRTRNAVNGQLFRGFESLSLRKEASR